MAEERIIPEGASPFSGFVPPVEHRWKPGQSGNPAGRPSAGATLREWLNVLTEAGHTEDELREIAENKKLPWPRRAAALRILRTLERGNLAEMEGWLDGGETLDDLQKAGINTEVVKKAKVTKKVIGTTAAGEDVTIISREIELHDRAGQDFDRVCDRTDGTPVKTVNLDAKMLWAGEDIVAVHNADEGHKSE